MVYVNKYYDLDGCYRFVFDDGTEAYYPKSSLMFIDDGSGVISVKATGSRRTLFLMRSMEPAFDGGARLTFADGTQRIITPAGNTFSLPADVDKQTLVKCEINEDYGYTHLNYGCFSGCTSITAITLPYTIEELPDNCCYNCKCLTSINIPLGVTQIPYRCFTFCESLQSIVLPNSVTSLNANCFYGCTFLHSIQMANNIQSLTTNNFGSCPNLLLIEISGDTIDISNKPFTSEQIIDIHSSNVVNMTDNLLSCAMIINDDLYDQYLEKYPQYTPNHVIKRSDYNQCMAILYNRTSPWNWTTIPDNGSGVISKADIDYNYFNLYIFDKVDTITDDLFEVTNGTMYIWSKNINILQAPHSEKLHVTYFGPHIKTIEGNPYNGFFQTPYVFAENLGYHSFSGKLQLDMKFINVKEFGDQSLELLSMGTNNDIQIWCPEPPKLGNNVFPSDMTNWKIGIPKPYYQKYLQADGWKDLADYLYPIE